MSYEFYKILHFLGLFMVFSALGGQLQQAMSHGAREFPARRFLAIMQGVGLLVAFVAGFGLIAKLGVGFPGWVIGKMAIWLIIGAVSPIALRKPGMARVLWFVVLLLGVIASYLARVKPF